MEGLYFCTIAVQISGHEKHDVQDDTEAEETILKYPIGDVARTLGLTPGALHFFEREGVVDEKSMEGGRRVYDREELVRLVSYKKYRSMEVPMKDIVSQIGQNGWDAPDILTRLTGQLEAAQDQVAHYTQLTASIAWYRDELDRALRNLSRKEMVMEPAHAILSLGDDGFISSDRHHQQAISAWLKYQPAVRFCGLRFPDGRCSFGYVADQSDGSSASLPYDALAVKQAAAPGIMSYQRLEKSFFAHPDIAFAPNQQYIRDHHLSSAGIGVCTILCVECAHGDQEVLCRTWQPIQLD